MIKILKTRSTEDFLTRLIKRSQKKKVPVTRKTSLRQEKIVELEKKSLIKNYVEIKRLAKANTKDITSEERIKLEKAEEAMRGEKQFRKQAKKQGINPGDLKNEEGSSANQYAELSLKTAKKALRKILKIKDIY